MLITLDIKNESKKETSTEEKIKTIKEKTKTNKLDYSKEEKSEYFKKELDELKNSIEDKIEDFLKNSKELKAFILFKNKHFRTYSFRNVFVNPKVHHLSIEKYTTLSKKIIAPSATFQFL